MTPSSMIQLIVTPRSNNDNNDNNDVVDYNDIPLAPASPAAMKVSLPTFLPLPLMSVYLVCRVKNTTTQQH